MSKAGSGYCPYCKKKTLLRKEGCNNVLHFILTLITGGSWAIIWLLVFLSQKYRCTQCGTIVKDGSSSVEDYYVNDGKIEKDVYRFDNIQEMSDYVDNIKMRTNNYKVKFKSEDIYVLEERRIIGAISFIFNIFLFSMIMVFFSILISFVLDLYNYNPLFLFLFPLVYFMFFPKRQVYFFLNNETSKSEYEKFYRNHNNRIKMFFIIIAITFMFVAIMISIENKKYNSLSKDEIMKMKLNKEKAKIKLVSSGTEKEINAFVEKHGKDKIAYADAMMIKAVELAARNQVCKKVSSARIYEDKKAKEKISFMVECNSPNSKHFVINETEIINADKNFVPEYKE